MNNERKPYLRPADLMPLLGIGRNSAYKLANRIGVRVSPRVLIVPTKRLDAWLEEQGSVGGK